jgi:hypothetical protein
MHITLVKLQAQKLADDILGSLGVHTDEGLSSNLPIRSDPDARAYTILLPITDIWR